MSHFAVLVITKETPSVDVLTPILQPWHQYECTGVKDQYVVEVDVTDEVRNCFDQNVSAVRLADGSHLSRYDMRFWKREAPDESSANKISLPDGAEEVELSADEARAAGLGQATMRAAAEYAFGSRVIERDGRFYDLTNPNKKWDWWTIGGRYCSRLRIKPGAFGLVGRSGLGATIEAARYDGARKGDIDFSAIAQDRFRERNEWVDEILQRAGERSVVLTRAQVEDACQADREVMAAWRQIPEPKPRHDELQAWTAERIGAERARIWDVARKASFMDLPKLSEGQSLDEWLRAAPPLSAFAVVKDGVWYEAGSMGWWAIVSDEQPDWDATFARLLAETSDDEFLTFVDCHI